MIKYLKKPIAWAVLTILMISCELQTNWDIMPDGEFIVADCIITNEMKVHELKLYRSVDQLNIIPEGFSGVLVQLSDGENAVVFEEDAAIPEGIYPQYLLGQLQALFTG